MNSNNYNKNKKELDSLYYLNPSEEDITECIKLMYKALSDGEQFFSKREIISKIVDDALGIGFSKDKIDRLLLWMEF